MQQKVVIIAILIILFSCFPMCYGGELYQAEVIKISDADSIWIRMNGRKIKLNIAGIDAPEEFKSRKMRMDSKRCHISRRELLYRAKENKKGLWDKYYKEMDCLCK